jgi:hypothetical protein
VGFEDRQDLLGHTSERITTHYSSAELGNLIAAANKACNSSEQRPVLTLLRNHKGKNTVCESDLAPAKIPQKKMG